VSPVEVTSSRITTVASGRCTSEPGLVEKAIGMKPTLATSTVMSTSRKSRPWSLRNAADFGESTWFYDLFASLSGCVWHRALVLGTVGPYAPS
jgi:hypothetical protein